MPPIETSYDPIVEILRLAYRRGLEIQREQAEKNKEISPPSSKEDLPTIEQELAQPVSQKDDSAK
jgi:hypothetical protein